ncbi:MAG TPA: helix-turn-helix transcriptional regulator [Candidatus Kapabacteria bacterium]|nr:helix-turn-helix transcriptional regulator [Candidatus Kapabacteria bacterium]
MVTASAKIVGVFLRMYREKTGTKEETLARDLNMSLSALSFLENGKREPSIHQLKSISAYFHLCIGMLLGIDCDLHRTPLRKPESNEKSIKEYAEYLFNEYNSGTQYLQGKGT